MDINRYISEPMYYFIAGLLVGIPIFLLLREFFCWYYKINKQVHLLEDIKEGLSNIANLLQKSK